MPMTVDELETAVAAKSPLPADAPPLLRALYFDAVGDWERAHAIAQDIDTPDGSWLHAYLHRKEGDAGNAAYWYRRAGRLVERASLADEWRTLAQTFCSR